LHGLTWGWIELLLALLVLLLLFARFRLSIDSEYGMSLLAALAGSIVALFVCRHGSAQFLPRDPSGPWYYHGIAGILFAIIGINSPHNLSENTSYLCVSSFAIAGLCFATMVWKFIRVRQQFTLRTLMLAALGIAILCGVSVYIPMVPLVVFLAVPALKWARFGPPSLRRGNDGPKNLKSEI